jgi:hypothetical protein
MLTVTALLVAGILAGYGALPRASAATPPLGTAAPFAVLAYSGITNTGTTTITGNVGSYPTPSETGFGTVTITGTNYPAGAPAQTQTDLAGAITIAMSNSPTSILTALDSQTLVAGTYSSASTAFTLSGGVLTLNGAGNSAGVWIFQAPQAIAGALTTVGGSIVLQNGANSCNVFWVTSAGGAIIGSSTAFIGTIMAYTSITLGTGASLQGAALANTGTVTMAGNHISKTCVMAPTTSTSTTATSSTATSTASTSTASTATTSNVGNPKPQCDSGVYEGYYTNPASGQRVDFSGLTYAVALNLVVNNPPAAMSCQFVPTPAQQCPPSGSPAIMTVNAQNANGTALVGFSVLFNCYNTMTTSTGFTPYTIPVIPGMTHIVAVLDYGCYAFDHWSDTGSALRYRSFSIMTDTTFTAVYRNTCQPIPATSSSISVNAVDSSGSPITGLYTTVWQNGVLLQSCFAPCSLTVSNGQSYQVAVSDFMGHTFSHWTDSTTSRFNTVQIGSTSTTIALTAVYA